MNHQYHDIGSPALTGSHRPTGTGFNLTAGGEDIWGSSDQFGFVHRTVVGDFDLAIRLEALEGCHHYTKGGLMAREGTGADAAHVFLLAFATDGARNNNSGKIEAQFRPATAAACTAIYPPGKGLGAPEFPVEYPHVWLRLLRKGAHWTCRVGRDGKTWQTYAEFDLNLSPSLEVGPAYTSHEGSKVGLARFRDVV